MSKNHCKIETQEIVKWLTCFVFHVNNDCKSADIFNVKLTCTKVEDMLLQLEPITNRWIENTEEVLFKLDVDLKHLY